MQAIDAEEHGKQSGALDDIDKAISGFLLAKTLGENIGDSHHSPVVLCRLGVNQLHHAQHTGSLSDIQQAISTLSKANNLIADGAADKPMSLNNLGSALQGRY